MTYNELAAYLQSYLQTNDPLVIAQVPVFLNLAAARITTDVRNALLEKNATLAALDVQPLPTSTMAVNQVRKNTRPVGYVTPQAFFSGATGYTIQSNEIHINPIQVGDVVTIAYYVGNDTSLMAGNLPQLFLHAAAAEAELFQGNNEDAAAEMMLYNSSVENTNGWDTFSGPISLGGNALAVVDENITVVGAPIAAIDVSYTPADNVFSTNVQNAITEVSQHLSSHASSTQNPHQVTLEQLEPVFVDNQMLVTFDGEWISVPITNFFGDVLGPNTSINNEVALFDGTTGKKIKGGGLLGTAAFKNVTTTVIDTTAERVLRTRDGGLLAPANEQSQNNWPNTSLNDCTNAGGGWYRTTASSTGMPTGFSVACLIMFQVQAYAPGTVIRYSQTIIDCVDGRSAIRTCNGAGTVAAPIWGEWRIQVSSVGPTQFAHNYLMNGGPDMWQRGSGPFTALGFTADRWRVNQPTGTFSLVLNPPAVQPPSTSQYGNAMNMNVTGATSGNISQTLENVRSCAATTVTLSYYYAAISGTDTGGTPLLQQFFGTGGSTTVNVSPVTDTTIFLGASTSRRMLTYNVPATTGKTIGTDSFLGVYIQYAGTFNKMYWNFQLEDGSFATPYVNRFISEEQNLVRRYVTTLPTQMIGQCTSATSAIFYYSLSTQLRAQPTLSTTAGWTINGLPVTVAVAAIWTNVLRLDVTGASGLVAGNVATLIAPAGVLAQADIG